MGKVRDIRPFWSLAQPQPVLNSFFIGNFYEGPHYLTGFKPHKSLGRHCKHQSKFATQTTGGRS